MCRLLLLPHLPSSPRNKEMSREAKKTLKSVTSRVDGNDEDGTVDC